MLTSIELELKYRALLDFHQITENTYTFEEFLEYERSKNNCDEK